MKLLLPSGVANFYRQAGLLALGSAGESQPSHRGFSQVPGSGRLAPATLSVPDYSGGTAPDSHRVPECLSVFSSVILLQED